MNDQFLYQFQKEPRSSFTQALYLKINQTDITRPHASLHRRLVLVVASIGLVLAVLLAYPPARALAVGLLQQIGHLFITHDPTYAEQFEQKLNTAPALESPSVTSEPIQWQPPARLSVSEASTQAGFQAVTLNDPPAGYQLVYRSVSMADPLNPFASVTTVFSDGTANLTLSQTLYPPDAEPLLLPAGSAEVTEVQVQGVSGYWLEGLRLSTYVTDDNQVQERYANQLIWQKDDFDFTLQSTPGLPLDQMLALANSIE